MSEELKACPWCHATPNRYDAIEGPYARCMTKACPMTSRFVALDVWNTRTPAPSDAARTESDDDLPPMRCFVCLEDVPVNHAGLHAFCHGHCEPKMRAALEAARAPTPPPMETAAVERLRVDDIHACIDAVDDNHAPFERITIVAAARAQLEALLTRLRATTTLDVEAIVNEFTSRISRWSHEGECDYDEELRGVLKDYIAERATTPGTKEAHDALAKYGRHLQSCAMFPHSATKPTPCDCGLDEALRYVD